MSREHARKAGMIAADRREHAVGRGWTGRYAMCGAGRIQLPLDREFDPTSTPSCADCAKVVRDGAAGAN